MLLFLAMLAAQLAPPLAQSPALPALHLICRGVGDHAVTHGESSLFVSHRGNLSSAFGASKEQVQFEDQMDIDLTGDARARVPRRFLPAFHGGDAGWFAIKDLVVTDDTITGTVLINVTNHPKLRIDRRIGSVNLDGKVGAYSGECQPYDPTTEKRAF